MNTRKIVAIIVIITIVSSIAMGVILVLREGRHTIVNKQYVALGDSVAAGIGVGTPTGTDDCARSDAAYPNVIATMLGMTVTNLACSGATLLAGILGIQSTDIDSQLNKLFALSTPAIITITIGANDAHWTTTLSECYQRECGTEADKVAFQGELRQIATHLNSMFDQLQSHYGKNVPRVYITGYYSIISTEASATTSSRIGMSATNVAWIDNLRTNLNTTIQQVAGKYDFVRYVPLDFTGHELFTADSWVQSLQDTAPVHPTKIGQEEIARQVVKVIQEKDK